LEARVMPYEDFPPQILPPGSRADNVPPAPTGTIFVIGPEGGYGVPPCRFTLLFGRNREDVHVPLGVDDPAVSRYHGEFTCAGPGEGWWLKNTGDLPIELPGDALLLTGQSRAVEPGYTPLTINRTGQRPHLLEVRLIKDVDRRPRATTNADTVIPAAVYALSEQERLVLAALAKSYLEGHELYPQPMTWQETADIANASPYATKKWGPRSVANTVEEIRSRLHRRGVRGLFRDQVGTNVGATLSINLIRELLGTATLGKQDLDLLGPRD
jgi:hypothetical protein